jgi:hypothetical protein
LVKIFFCGYGRDVRVFFKIMQERFMVELSPHSRICVVAALQAGVVRALLIVAGCVRTSSQITKLDEARFEEKIEFLVLSVSTY